MVRDWLLLMAWCGPLVLGANVNVTDYVYWKKQDILQWNQFFPTRYIEEERLTILEAANAVSSMASGINDSLHSIVTFQTQELIIAQQMMAGTDAEGCIDGISTFLDKAIQTEVDNYSDCTADALSKLTRLNSSLSRLHDSYQAAFNRALDGIDVCARTYPNKASIDRLRSCVDSMIRSYSTTAGATQIALSLSPSMTYFHQTAVQCASSAARAVATKGHQFLNMLAECATVSGHMGYNIDPKQWEAYEDTLDSQISRSQHKNYNKVSAVEDEMVSFYKKQKQALEQYVVESRDLAFYLAKVYGYLSEYYNTVTAASLDNPADTSCVDTARQALDTAAQAGATKALEVDQLTVNSTRQLLNNTLANFMSVNDMMPLIGNVAILQCFSRGWIFAPNTIADCFNLNHSRFNIDSSEHHSVVVSDVATLDTHFDKFYSSSSLPCGDSYLDRLLLAAEEALYELQRCLYVSSGSTYAVTTPWNSSTGFITETTSMPIKSTPTIIYDKDETPEDYEPPPI